eukprot:gene4905-5149_t
MTQGNIAKWYVNPGDEIAPGTVLADIETDKATLAFENQEDGFIAAITKPEGSKDVPVRKIIAKRLLESKLTAPSLYLSADVALDAINKLRKSLTEQGSKVSVNDFVMRAAALALRDVPAANAFWDEGQGAAVQQPSVDVCVAVATDGGLITPIVKAADTKSLLQISQEVKDLAARARANKLKPEEFMGGTFSISNLGMYGLSSFSAIINPPQAAILAVGGAQKRVSLSAGDGRLSSSSYMTVTLSADHRLFDGDLATQLLDAFTGYMESPLKLVM